MKKDYNKLRKTFIDDPEMLRSLDMQEQAELLKEVAGRDYKFAESIKGDKGDKGDEGYTPIKGTDYLTPDELQSLSEEIRAELKEEVTPVKGVDYFDGEKGEPGKSIVGPRGPEGKQGKSIVGPMGPAGKDGKDGENADIDAVIKELKKQKLDMRDIKNMPLNMNDMRWHGGGISNITGLIQAGTNVTITGSGTSSDPYIINASGGGAQTLAQTLAAGNVTGGTDIVVSTGDKIIGQTDLLLSAAGGNNYYYAGPNYIFQQWYDGLGAGNTDFLLQGNGTQLFSHTAMDIQTDTGLYGFFSGTGTNVTGTFNFTGLASNRSYAFPNASGTIALTSDIPAALTLTNTHIFVGNAGNVPTDVALTLNTSTGSFGLANTGVLTIPDATTAVRGFMNFGTQAFSGSKTWNTGADANIAAIFKGNSATQSAHLTEWQTSAGTVIGFVENTGRTGWGTNAPLSTVSGIATFSVKQTIDDANLMLFETATASTQPRIYIKSGSSAVINFAWGLLDNIGRSTAGVVWRNVNHAAGTADMALFTRGAGDALTVKDGGNVLIGTTTDDGSHKLQVNGTATIAGSILGVRGVDYTWPSANAAGVLTNNGSGTLTWGSASGITLKTNGTNNGDQTLLNLAQGSNITLTDNGTGTVTIAATGGGGSPGGADTNVQYNDGGSAFGGDANFTWNKGSFDFEVGNPTGVDFKLNNTAGYAYLANNSAEGIVFTKSGGTAPFVPTLGLSLDTSTGSYKIGAISGGNNTNIDINDSTQQITLSRDAIAGLNFQVVGNTGQTYKWSNSSATPGTNLGVGIVNFYGTNATNFLGDPNGWALVNVGGTDYKIPLYQ